MIELVILAILTLCATIVSTLAGFGASMILIPILQFLLPVHHVLVLVGCIHWFNSVGRMMFFRQGLQREFILLFSIPCAIASFFGASIAMQTPGTTLSQIIGIGLILYVLLSLTEPAFTLPTSKASMVPGGLFVGFFTGIFGFGGALRGAYLTAYKPPHTAYLATLAVTSFIIDCVRVPTYISQQTFDAAILAKQLLITLPAAFLATWITSYYARGMTYKQFRYIVSFFLILAGLKFALIPGK